MKPWLRSTGVTPSGPRSRRPAGPRAPLAAAFATALGIAVAAAAVAQAEPPTNPGGPMIPSGPSGAYGAVVPVGIRIPVALVGQISSATAHVGDRFDFKTVAAQTIGTLQVPAGTPGHGRVASVVVASKGVDGSVGLQADSIDLPGDNPLWVDVDPKVQIKGFLADHRTRIEFLEVNTQYYGNMILADGTRFGVITIARRAAPAPLVTGPDSARTPVPAMSPPPMTEGQPSPVPSPT